MKPEEKIASRICERHGLAFESAVRAGGWTNAVWLCGDVVLRLATKPGTDRIRREVELSGSLPPAVGYPAPVCTGIEQGHEWSLSKRIPGVNLSEAWPGLSWAQRADAVGQIAQMMRAVHAVDIGAAGHLVSDRPWYSSLDKEETAGRVEGYVGRQVLTHAQGAALRGRLEVFWEALSASRVVLNHGDITRDNILWNEEKVAAFIDFEHALLAPPQVDVHSLFNLAFFDDEGTLFSGEGDQAAFEQYRKAAAAIVSSFLGGAQDGELLWGYALLYQLIFLDFWLENPEGELAELASYRKLLSLIDDPQSYFGAAMGT